MALTQRLDLRQTQALVMTPQLQQAIKLLQLSNLELAAYIEGELEQNPLLERDDRPAEPRRRPSRRRRRPAPRTASAGTRRPAARARASSTIAGDPEAWRSPATAASGDDLPGLDQTLVPARPPCATTCWRSSRSKSTSPSTA